MLLDCIASGVDDIAMSSHVQVARKVVAQITDDMNRLRSPEYAKLAISQAINEACERARRRALRTIKRAGNNGKRLVGLD